MISELSLVLGVKSRFRNLLFHRLHLKSLSLALPNFLPLEVEGGGEGMIKLEGKKQVFLSFSYFSPKGFLKEGGNDFSEI